MKVFSKSVALPEGLPLGGYAGERLSTHSCDSLEVNGWAFADAVTGRMTELCSVDALYAGDLVGATQREEKEIIFAASHTHYAPMLDSSKPQIGVEAKFALDQFAQSILTSPRVSAVPDVCRILRAHVNVPVYRRFDSPDNVLNRLLTSRLGMFPNETQPIDKSLYIFEFARGDRALFTLAYHACHPVSRHSLTMMSPDYIGAIRGAIRARFGALPCLFLLGCAGDIRPNLTRKRVSWLPRGRLNWRFEWPNPLESEELVDKAYAITVHRAQVWRTLSLGQDPVHVRTRVLSLKTLGNIEIPTLTIAGCLKFEFVPFEVSHHFHLNAQQRDPMRFIVSCSNHTLGYLPHPKQLLAGGYEVDGSRACMGLTSRVELSKGALW